MKLSVNANIALSHLLSRKKQTIVASLGVTFGISMYIFLQSLMTGTNQYFEEQSFNSIPHIKLYHDVSMSNLNIMDRYYPNNTVKHLINPKQIESSNRLHNPYGIIRTLLKDTSIRAITPQVATNVFYNNGNTQLGGTMVGVNILEEDKMFNLKKNILQGSLEYLLSNPNSLLIGKGISQKLNLKVHDNVIVSTPFGVVKNMKIAGIYETSIMSLDNTKSYANIHTVQQLLKKQSDYITEIKINIHDYQDAPQKARWIEQITGYKAEDWVTANEPMQAGFKIRAVILNSVIVVMLLVAGFGIYNILNMTIYEKMKDIAILKTTGFDGRDVVGIFLREAIYIGLAGAILGLIFGFLISYGVSKIELGTAMLKYLPMSFLWEHYIQGLVFGISTTLLAGYLPARKAAKVDPVEIIRG